MGKNGAERRLRIYFTGVGGQGTLTATTLLAGAAMCAGLDVVAGEVHGMAQRGGVVESVVLLGGWRSPRLDFGEADVLLGFEPLETLRGLPYLRTGGAVFSSSNPLPPLGITLGNGRYPDMALIEGRVRNVAGFSKFLPCRDLGISAGSAQSGNTVLLGAACAAGVLPFGTDMLKNAVRNLLPSKIQEINLKALALGAAA